MRKAGKLEIGETATSATVQAGEARLVLVASDASEKVRKIADSILDGRRALLVELPFTGMDLSEKLGKAGCSILATKDIGLSSAFLKALAESEPARYGPLAQEMERRADKAAKRKAAGPKRKPGRVKHE